MGRRLRLIEVVAALSLFTLAQCRKCGFNQYLVPGGSSHKIDSNGVIARGSRCVWRSFTDPKAIIELTCPVFNLPVVPITNIWRPCDRTRRILSTVRFIHCNGQVCLDQFIVSDNKNGANSITYCGKKKLYHVTKGSNLYTEIIADRRPAVGKFSCTVRALTSTTKPPQGAGCSCGYSFKSRIVGGQETGINEFPMMSALVSKQLNDIFCGSTIVTQRHAITAGHCLTDRKVNDIALLVGEHDISTGKETNSSLQVKVSKIHIHPQFDQDKLQNDIGIVETYDRLRFTPRVGPACLPIERSNNFNGEIVQALGWGTLEFGGRRSDKLQKVSLKVVSIADCQAVYQAKIYPTGQMCTKGGVKDACQYDSGGPLLWEDTKTNRLMLVGVISYGRGCGLNYPGVNTRVYAYLNWITQIISKENYCNVR